jgi:iron complex outermembrane receptor protein
MDCGAFLLIVFAYDRGNGALADLVPRTPTVTGGGDMKILRLLACAFVAVSFTTPVLGQEDSDQRTVLDEIIVTTTKREESAQDVPFSVTPITAEMIENASILDITDLGFLVPNVQLQAVSTFPGFATLSIRGVGAGANSIRSIDPAVNIFSDGIVLASQIGAQLDLFDVETVEVLRGPQGVFFGRNSTGGAVALRTGKPTKDFNGRVKLAAGSDGMLGAEFIVQGSLGDTVRAKLAMKYYEFDGYFEDKNGGTFVPAEFNPLGTEPGTPTQQQAKQSSIFIKPTITFEPSDSFNLTLFMQYYKDDGGAGSTQAYLDPDLPDPPMLTSFGYTPPTDQFEVNHDLVGLGELEFTQLVVDADWDVGAGTITSITGFRDLDMLNSIDVDGTPFLLIHFPENEETASQFSQEFRYITDLTDNVDLLLGLFYMESDMSVIEQREFTGLTAGRDHFDFNYIRSDWTQDQSSTAVFGNLRFALADKWTASVGVRYTEEDKDIDVSRLQGCAGPGFTGCATNRDLAGESWSNTAPRLGLELRPHEDLLYYLTWTRGFRSGNFNARAGSPAQLGPADPEQSDQVEIGMKGDFLDDTLRANIAVFYTKYDEIQRITNGDIGGVPVQLLRNAAEATIPGVEVELTWIATDALTLRGSFGWIDPQFDKFTGLEMDMEPGLTPEDEALAVLLDFERIPKFEYTLVGDYRWGLGGDGDLIFRVQYAYRDGFPTDVTNRPERYIDDFALLDLSLRYVKDSLRVSIWGRNVAEENYGDIISSAFNQQQFGGQGTAYGADVTWNF